jgi:hypothetical protein
MRALPRLLPAAGLWLAALLPLPAQTAAPASDQVVKLERFVVTPSHFDLTDAGAGSPSTLTQRDLESLPQIGEDLFRSIARLPGVTADDFTAKFWVRGAPQRQLLVRLDGADLLEPFHLKDVDGALSIIDLHAIRRLDLMTGGFNSDYGNRTAGVLTMESLNATGPDLNASLGLSLTSMRAGGAGTFAHGAGRWFGSIRRGYPDIALRAEGRSDDIFPRYWDAYAKAEFDVAPGHTVSLHALHSGDTLRVLDDNGPELRSAYDSDNVWGRWRAQFSDNLSAETVATASWLTWHRDGSGLYSNRYHIDLSDRRSLSAYDVRQDWSYSASPSVYLRGGWEYGTAAADYSYHLFREDPVVSNGVLIASPRTITLAPSPEDTTTALFVAPRFAVTPALTVEPGLRFDRHTAAGDSDVSPRLNAAFTLGPRTTLRAAWGLYAQSMGLQELPVQFGDPTFQRAEIAQHRVLSLDHRFASGLTLRVEAYQRLTAHPRSHWLNRFDTYNVFPEAQTDRLLIAPSSAEAKGVEFLAQRKGHGPFDWTLSYALSKADEQAGAATLPGLRDQRHAFYGDLTWSPNARWRFSAAWQYHTGWPITLVNYTLTTLSNGSRVVTRSFGPTLGSRLAAYHRLDLRASRTIPTKHGVVKVFVDIFNAYDHANAIAYDYDTSVSAGVLTVTKKPRLMLPILPTAGVSWEL